MDERYLETIPEVDSIYSRPTSIATTALPELPFRAVGSLHPSQAVLEEKRTSSVYSQPSPIIPDETEEETEPEPDSVRSEISPLSTPRASVDNLSVSPLASPMTANFSANLSRPEPQYKSQIPRRKVPGPHGTSEGSSAEKKTTNEPLNPDETKWDDYSGEPSSTGKPPTVRPGAQPLEMQYPQLKERTKQILAGLRERENPKKQAWGRVPPPVEPSSLDNPVAREPWKGPSGRTALVEPVRDTPVARLQPLRIPPRNTSLQNATVSQPSSANDTSEVSRSPPPAESPAVASPATIRAVQSQESIKPPAPLKLGTNSPRVRSPVTAEHLAALQTPFQSPHVPNDHSIHTTVTTPTTAYIRPDSPTLNAEDTSMPLSAGTSALEPTTASVSTNPGPESGGLQSPEEPKSRFSWTTYATTVSDSSTPRSNPTFDESPMPPMPALPSPIVVRKRPAVPPSPHGIYTNIDMTLSNASVVARKPVAATERGRATSMMTTASLSKALPQCPPEIEANDKITTLEARMQDLARRKGNLGKIIKEMSDRLRRNSISYDVRKRKEVEKMIINLKLELAEVSQEEHEVGIRLHRAHKKRDRDDNYESPTGLWVKRVTS